MNQIINVSKLALHALTKEKVKRDTEMVTDAYNANWRKFENKLDNSNTIEEWLDDRDNIKRYSNIEGKWVKQVFDSSTFYREIFSKNLLNHFPKAKSMAEFGCGLGRNLIYMYLKNPNIKYYGFELCQPGVDIANKAAKKFNLPIEYKKLDYLNWLPTNIQMPNIDVGFTIFSLEQIPKQSDNFKSLNNILSQVNIGSLHLEPVAENYPKNLKGLISRIDHRKVQYLTDFSKSINTIPNIKIESKEVFNTSHNPFMYPTLYVLKKSK